MANRPRGSGTIALGYKRIGVDYKIRAEHVMVAERAIGRPLPKGAEVHHVNENKLDNRGENLVICPDRSYHRLLHTRTEAINATGNPDHRKCVFCKKWDSPDALLFRTSGAQHAKCRREYDSATKSGLRATVPKRKLTDSQVLEIRGEIQRGTLPSITAKRFNISKATVQDIRRGRRHKNIINPEGK